MVSLTPYPYLSQSKNELLLDVRSPAEYAQGHIPHALNLPLFINEERVIVGTLYKREGRQAAIEKGLELVGPKLKDFAEFARKNARSNKVFLYCWRGGMRSGSMAWLLNMLGYKVATLQGGYKAYRNFVLKQLAQPRKYLVLGGKTGSAKTELLQLLQQQGAQVVCLETLAHHKGSSFGHLQESAQPTNEQFENNLCATLLEKDATKSIWLEDESRNMGRCFMPMGFWNQLRTSPLVVLELPASERLAYVMKVYGKATTDELSGCFKKLEKRLGNEAMKNALQFLAEGKVEAAAHIALRYYDKTYTYSLNKKDTKDMVTFHFNEINLPAIAKKLLAYADTRK